MFEYRLSEEQAMSELQKLLEKVKNEKNFELLADIGLCYHIVNELELAEDFYWQSYNTLPNKYAAINLNRLYLKNKMIDKLENAYFRFANDKIIIHTSDGLKLFSKENRIETIKKLCELNWGPVVPYLKRFYNCGEYEYCTVMIEKKYNLCGMFLTDTGADILYYWLLCKEKLERYDEIQEMLYKMSLSSKKKAMKKLIMVSQESDKPEVYLSELEDLYAESNYSNYELQKCLELMYKKIDSEKDRIELLHNSIKKQRDIIRISFNRLCTNLYRLDKGIKAEDINELYKNIEVEFEKILEDI